MMKKLVIGEPVIVSQSTTEAIRAGGWQDPEIRCSNGVLYVRFSGVRDEYENHDRENRNPVFKSVDCGVTWARVENPAKEWTEAQTPISNGDKVRFTGSPLITDKELLAKLGEPAVERGADKMKVPAYKGVYTNAEMRKILGDDCNKTIMSHRLKKGETELVNQLCEVRWDDLAYGLVFNGYVGAMYAQPYREDKDGVLYLPVATHCVNPDGSLVSGYRSMSMLKSTDHGYSWEHVGTCEYHDEYNIPNAIEVEGFMECAFEICDDGSFFMIMRSGSISPYVIGDDDHPSPKCMITYSYDKGKTWTKPEVFYEYGVLPRSVKKGDGTILMTSGRPDVYVRACYDGKGKEWDDVIHVLDVPKEYYYNGYWEYTCSNNDVCAYDDKTAFLTYSNFQLTTPEGVRAKSIIVRKISIVEE
ncbi:MAG: exo-alpha-sialidase [Clostridia bacterium]|nr:exo-alpha-sialidase [Clostridia bacterium]